MISKHFNFVDYPKIFKNNISTLWESWTRYFVIILLPLQLLSHPCSPPVNPESSSCCPTSRGYGVCLECVLWSRGHTNKTFWIGHCILVKFGYYIHNCLANYERGNRSLTHTSLNVYVNAEGHFCVHAYMCLCVLIRCIEVRGQPQLYFLRDYPPPPPPSSFF